MIPESVPKVCLAEHVLFKKSFQTICLNWLVVMKAFFLNAHYTYVHAVIYNQRLLENLSGLAFLSSIYCLFFSSRPHASFTNQEATLHVQIKFL